MREDFNNVKVHELVGEEQTALVHHYQKGEDGNWYEVFGGVRKQQVSKNKVYALVSTPFSTEQLIEISKEEREVL